jgi:hypothetical protein
MKVRSEKPRKRPKLSEINTMKAEEHNIELKNYF